MSIFDSVKVSKPKRSTFDLSHQVLTSCNAGDLIPVLCQEVMPGDTFRVNTQAFVRMAPMVAPIMQKLDVYVHYFFVPMRLITDKWEDFITGGKDGTSFPRLPYATFKGLYDSRSDQANSGDLMEGSLLDHLGLPPISHNENGSDVVPSDYKFSLLPFKAYQKIYNDWYRDENLQTELNLGETNAGDQSNTDEVWDYLTLRKRAWRKDYFTSALPWPQRGPQVTLPISADVDFGVSPLTAVNANGQPISAYQTQNNLFIDKAYPGQVRTTSTNGNNVQVYTDAPEVQNVNIASPTINEVRRSFRVQEWLEKQARGGYRLIESILSHFGVQSSDARLQRPEYLGGGITPIMISEIVQNAPATEFDKTPQGTMSGHGVTASSMPSFKHFFEEHGYLMALVSILPKASYYTGVNRMWSREDKFDFAWPEFANLGEQEIKAQELDVYRTGTSNLDDTFGYTPRYAEYKYHGNEIHGDFRSSLNSWHLGRTFKSRPYLNSSFITCGDASLNRIFAFEDGDHYWMQIEHNISAKRPLPYYGTPTI